MSEIKGFANDKESKGREKDLNISDNGLCIDDKLLHVINTEPRRVKGKVLMINGKVSVIKDYTLARKNKMSMIKS